VKDVASLELMALEQDQRISEVVKREQSRLGNFIRRRVPDPRDAEDILQDVFSELVEANRLLMPIEHVTGWLFRVARNRITDLFRKKRPEGFSNSAVTDPQLQTGMNGMLKMFQTDRGKFTDRFVRGMYVSKQSEEYIAHVEEQALKTPTNTAITEMFNVLSKGDFTPALAKLDKPVIYICEAQLESQSKLLQASIPQARVDVMKNAAHALFVDDAAHFNQVVADFVNSLPALPAK
jgi:RNA polymerase sigma factor (sigma-70 family)